MDTGLGGLFGPRPRPLTMRVRERGRGPNRKEGWWWTGGGFGRLVEVQGNQESEEKQIEQAAAAAARASVAGAWSGGGVRCRWGWRSAVAERCGERRIRRRRRARRIGRGVISGRQREGEAALVVAPRLVLADLLLGVAAARATLSRGTGRTSLRLRHDHRSRRTLGDRDWCRVALKQRGETCRGVVLGDVVHVDHRRGNLGVSHHGHHV